MPYPEETEFLGLHLNGPLQMEPPAQQGAAGQWDMDANSTIIDEAMQQLADDAGITNVTPQNSNYAAKANDFVLCDTSAGGFTVTIPLSAANAGKPITVKKKSSDTNVLLIVASGSDSLDTLGASVEVIWQGTALDFVADGTATWDLV
jgi:hypothetical protein